MSNTNLVMSPDTCIWCGKDMSSLPHYPHRMRKFCCRSCNSKAMWANHPVKKKGRKGTIIKKPCEWCQKEISGTPSYVNKVRFCSWSCASKAKRVGKHWGRHFSDSDKEKSRLTMLSPEVNEKISSKLRGEKNPFFGKHHTAEQRRISSERNKELIRTSPEYRKQLLEYAYKGWLTLTKQLQRYRSLGLPNPAENKLYAILEDLCPGQYSYNNGWFQLGGKIPDFVNINGKKKLIELFGEGYHKKIEEETRPAYLKQYGWDTLVVWAKEIDSGVAFQKIKHFLEV